MTKLAMKFSLIAVPIYEKQCGRQKPVQTKRLLWKCVKTNFENWDCHLRGPVGVWMISECPANWSSDKLGTKCENVPSEFSSSLEDFIPVVAAKGQTFRIEHCALCNGVDYYTAWDIVVFTYIIPPEEFNLTSKLKFIKDNGGKIVLQPKPYQSTRFCYGRNFINQCTFLTKFAFYKACVDGPVEVVSAHIDLYEPLYFKNSVCALCNGYNSSSFDFNETCASDEIHPFSITFDLKGKTSRILEVAARCPSGTVYDYTLQFCRKLSYVPPQAKLPNDFLLLVWFKYEQWTTDYPKLESNLKSALITQCWLRESSNYRHEYAPARKTEESICCNISFVIDAISKLNNGEPTQQ